MELHPEEQVPLAPLTTLKVGGAARYFLRVTSAEDLEAARRFAKRTAVPPLILGSGSNLLIPDTGYPGLVIAVDIGGIEETSRTDQHVTLRVGAGMEWDSFVAYTVERGLWGIENLSAIPGTVGATPVQNVGAYGVEVESVIESVEAFHLVSGESRSFTPAECEFSYRDSFFKSLAGREWVITQVSFGLSLTPQPELSYKDLAPLQEQASITQTDIRAEVRRIRAGKFPDWTTVGTAGSFFKNPVIPADRFHALREGHPELPGYEQPDGSYKIALGWILDKLCGLRGHCAGPVCLSEHQALVLINDGGTATEVDRFALWVEREVKQKTGITIEREVTMIPELSP